jgi:hypothetical protein
MEIGRLEHGTDPQRRTRQLRLRMIEHQCSSTRRDCETQDHPQRRRLASAIRAEKAVIVAASNANDRSVTAETSPNRLVNDSALTTAVIRVADR